MKEVSAIPQDEVRQVQPAQHAKQPQLIHRMRPHKGQKVYEFNPKENTLKEVTISKPPVANYLLAKQGKLSPVRKRVDAKSDCFYIAALNPKNAIKKVRQISINGFPLFCKANPKFEQP